MSDKPMSDAEIAKMVANILRTRTMLVDPEPTAADLERIAKRLEEIDRPKFVIPLHYFQACSDAGVPITWIVDEEKPT